MIDNRDFGRQLYPFLYEDSATATPTVDSLLEDVRRSTIEKSRDVAALRARIITEYRELLVDTAFAMTDAFRAGGKLLAFGNGGSATDAQDATIDCLTPARPHWRPLPAIALVDDVATLTAVGNDVGFDHVFARQIIAFGAARDIAVGFSTSGNSPNVIRAFTEAKGRGLLTIALTGADGGVLARSKHVDFCFVSRIEHIPRIQEGHATVWHTLLELVQEILA